MKERILIDSLPRREKRKMKKLTNKKTRQKSRNKCIWNLENES